MSRENEPKRGNRMNRRMWGEERRTAPIMVGVDIGSVGVRVVVTALQEQPRPYNAVTRAVTPQTIQVFGLGEAVTRGMRRGSATDADALGESLREAVALAQAQSGHRVLRATLTVPLTVFETPHGGVRVTLPTRDSVREVLRPTCRHADIWDEVAAIAGIEFAGVIPGAVAAMAGVVLPEEQAAGVALVECGAEQTSVAVIADGIIQRVVALPVGGDHITRDLATLLGIRPMEAERLKLLVGNMRSMRETEHPARGIDGSRKLIAAALVAAIVAARVEQIMQRVAEVIRPIHGYSLGAARATVVGSVVLCGGGAALSGIAHMARGTLGVPVRIAGPWGVAGSGEAQTPGYAATLGVVRWWEMAQTGRMPGTSLMRDSNNSTPSAVNRSAGPSGQSRWQAWLREFLP